MQVPDQRLFDSLFKFLQGDHFFLNPFVNLKEKDEGANTIIRALPFFVLDAYRSEAFDDFCKVLHY